MNNEINNFFNKFLAESAIHSVEGRDIVDWCEEGSLTNMDKFIRIDMIKRIYDEIKKEYEMIEFQKSTHQSKKKFLFVEDGSVDTDALIEELHITNPEIKVVIYRQGTDKPELKELGGNDAPTN